MNKLEEYLADQLERNIDNISYWAIAVKEVVSDIRAILTGCSILEWHPPSENPPKCQHYIVEVALWPSMTISVKTSLFDPLGNWADLCREDKVIRWTELPESPR